MKKEIRNKIEEIMAGMECPRGFTCAASGFTDLCKARVIGTGSYLECLDEGAGTCTFALQAKPCPLCRCPLRIYLSENLDA